MFNLVTATARITATRALAGQFRLLHSTPVAAKGVTEKVTEVADKVGHKVGKGLADVIEKGEVATHKAKQTLAEKTKGVLGTKAGDMKDQAEHASNVASHKVNQVLSATRRATEDVKDEIKK